MIDEWEDISFTAKPSFLNGMRLFRHKVSGETRLVDEHGPVRRVDVQEEEKKPRKPRRKAKSEGDK